MNSWYLLYCKNGYKATVPRIRNLGVEILRPVMMKVIPRKDTNGTRSVQEVLFPSYLFLSFDVNRIHTSRITEVPGALYFVRCGDRPLQVPQEVIFGLKYNPYAVLNGADQAVECRNVHPATMATIYKIADFPESEAREVALLNLIKAVCELPDNHPRH